MSIPFYPQPDRSIQTQHRLPSEKLARFGRIDPEQMRLGRIAVRFLRLPSRTIAPLPGRLIRQGRDLNIRIVIGAEIPRPAELLAMAAEALCQHKITRYRQ